MSLDTVLKIGNIYRKSNIGLEQHRYINSVWKDVEIFNKAKDEKGNLIETVFLGLPVVDTGTEFIFDFKKIYQIHDEDKKRNLKYLNFKTSDRDSSVRYLLGDIIYKSYGKEGGNFRIKEEGKNSFTACEETAKSVENTIVGKFRICFKKSLSEIENILKSHNAVVLHFDFNDKSWFEIEEFMSVANQKLVDELFLYNESLQKYAPNKTVFKTIKTPTFSNGAFKEPEKGGGVTPNFRLDNSYKIATFTKEEAFDLLYSIGISQKTMISVQDFSILIMPNGDKLSADVLDRFFLKKGVNNIIGEEENLKIENNSKSKNEDFDNMFEIALNNDFEDDVKFDFIFMKPPVGSSPSVDMIEISSIRKSKLREIHDRIINVKNELRIASDKLFAKTKIKLPKYDIKESFSEVLKQKGKTQKKYSFHLLKVLPQIYTDTYYNDPILLSTFIEKVERNIRDDSSNFNILKFDFYFLMKIQKNDNMSLITNTKSYAIGISLGKMAKPFAAWRDDCPIKSFEKNYVGNLSRRIGDTNDLMKFCNFLNEKLTIHERNYKDTQEAYLDLINNLKELGNSKEKYDKNACALGFFESYFSR